MQYLLRNVSVRAFPPSSMLFIAMKVSLLVYNTVGREGVPILMMPLRLFPTAIPCQRFFVPSDPGVPRTFVVDCRFLCVTHVLPYCKAQICQNVKCRLMISVLSLITISLTINLQLSFRHESSIAQRLERPTGILEGHGFEFRWGTSSYFLSHSTWERFIIYSTLSESPFHLSVIYIYHFDIFEPFSMQDMCDTWQPNLWPCPPRVFNSSVAKSVQPVF